ncbi:hypothetical protein Tco_1510319, partial [Tanacetum coccineum]
ARIQNLKDAQKPREGFQEDAPNRGGIDQGEVNVFKGDAEKDSSRSTNKGTSRGLKEVFTTASPQVPLVSSNVSIAEVLTTAMKDPLIKKYQAQKQRLASKSKRRKFYTSVLRSHAGWKTKDVRGMTFDQLEEKFILVWESIQDFVPMDSKKESESLKRSGILLEKVKTKRLKTSDVSAQEQQESDNQDEIINL